jgi:hypothetical protein
VDQLVKMYTDGVEKYETTQSSSSDE